MRRLVALVCISALAVGLSACGKTNDPSSAENNGVYVYAGPMAYQLQVSRELNPYSPEDSQYVRGLPAGASASLSPTQIWYGVFLWAKNQTHQAQTTSDNFDIVDTEGNHYYPLAISRTANAYAWTSERLGPNGIEPAPDTAASLGPTQGGLLLFKLNTSAYDDRPLMLEIKGPSGQVWGKISLDL